MFTGPTRKEAHKPRLMTMDKLYLTTTRKKQCILREQVIDRRREFYTMTTVYSVM